MGCFSTNCAVSKLPIYGHPVVGIPISKNPFVDRRRVACYPDADWQLDGFPFFGKNDDYGRVEEFEKGKYHDLNLKRYGEITEDIITEWCQPGPKDKNQGTKSIMFIHKPVWDELMKRWGKFATAYYEEDFERENLYKKEQRESFKKAWEKKVTAANKKKFQEMYDNILIKCPAFQHDGTGFSYDFTKWCNNNFSPKIKKALIDLLAFSMSCTVTHTLYSSPNTLGEQISDWKGEASWTKFVAGFAAAERKNREEN